MDQGLIEKEADFIWKLFQSIDQEGTRLYNFLGLYQMHRPWEVKLLFVDVRTDLFSSLIVSEDFGVYAIVLEEITQAQLADLYNIDRSFIIPGHVKY